MSPALANGGQGIMKQVLNLFCLVYVPLHAVQYNYHFKRVSTDSVCVAMLNS